MGVWVCRCGVVQRRREREGVVEFLISFLALLFESSQLLLIEFYYFFFMAFSAALVVLPPETSFGLTDLITPTATVCLISRTAKRPNGGKSVKVSTESGFDGARSMIAASPDLMNFGLSSIFLPERRSIFSLMS